MSPPFPPSFLPSLRPSFLPWCLRHVAGERFLTVVCTPTWIVLPAACALDHAINMPSCLDHVTPTFCLRLFGAVWSLTGFIVLLTAQGKDVPCEETNHGPGHDICPPEYPYTDFGSCIFYLVISFFTFLWSALMILLSVCDDAQQPDFFLKHGERIEHGTDFTIGLLNLLAYLLMVFELNESSQGKNQGQSVMDMAEDKVQYGWATAISFVAFLASNLTIAYNLKITTRGHLAAANASTPGKTTPDFKDVPLKDVVQV